MCTKKNIKEINLYLDQLAKDRMFLPVEQYVQVKMFLEALYKMESKGADTRLQLIHFSKIFKNR